MNTIATTDKLTLSIPETAAALGVSRPTVYNLIRREGFPAFRIGGERSYPGPAWKPGCRSRRATMLPKIENAPAGVTAPAEAAGTGLQATAPATNDSIPPRRKQAVSAILPHGAASAVDSLTLVNMLGYKDRRELTQQIERERQAGSPICAVTSGDHRGYFLPVDAGELAHYISSIDRRIRAISRTRNACGETLRRMIGQEQIEGW